MSTNGLKSWAVDLADVGAVYPFQGLEFILYIAALVFWLVWHISQMRAENAEMERMKSHSRGDGHIQRAIERY